jgi:hypothetical protein
MVVDIPTISCSAMAGILSHQSNKPSAFESASGHRLLLRIGNDNRSEAHGVIQITVTYRRSNDSELRLMGRGALLRIHNNRCKYLGFLELVS